MKSKHSSTPNPPDEGRDRHAVSDPYQPYATVLANELPDARLVVDHFHVIRLANAALNDVCSRRSRRLRQGDRPQGKAASYAMGRLSGSLCDEFDSSRRTQSAWLDDYALFLALKDRFDGRAWTWWDHDVRGRSVEPLASATSSLDKEITLYSFRQWLSSNNGQGARRGGPARHSPFQ